MAFLLRSLLNKTITPYIGAAKLKLFNLEDEKGGAILNGPRIFMNENLKNVEVISHIEEEVTSNLLKKFFRSKRNK